MHGIENWVWKLPSGARRSLTTNDSLGLAGFIHMGLLGSNMNHYNLCKHSVSLAIIHSLSPHLISLHPHWSRRDMLPSHMWTSPSPCSTCSKFRTGLGCTILPPTFWCKCSGSTGQSAWLDMGGIPVSGLYQLATTDLIHRKRWCRFYTCPS